MSHRGHCHHLSCANERILFSNYCTEHQGQWLTSKAEPPPSPVGDQQADDRDASSPADPLDALRELVSRWHEASIEATIARCTDPARQESWDDACYARASKMLLGVLCLAKGHPIPGWDIERCFAQEIEILRGVAERLNGNADAAHSLAWGEIVAEDTLRRIRREIPFNARLPIPLTHPREMKREGVRP